MVEVNGMVCSVSLLVVRDMELGAIGDVGEDGTLAVVEFWLSKDLIRLCTPGEGSPRRFLNV